jgi:hypothetical protein
MSRPKGSKTVGLLSKVSNYQKRLLMAHGNIASTKSGCDYLRLAQYWDHLLETETRLDKIPVRVHQDFWWKTKSNFKRQVANAKAEFFEKLRTALQTGDAGFLEDFKKAVEAYGSWRSGNRHDPERSAIIETYFDPFTHVQMRKPQFSEVKYLFSLYGFSKEEKHLREMCKQVGLELAPGKRGAPKKAVNT